MKKTLKTINDIIRENFKIKEHPFQLIHEKIIKGLRENKGKLSKRKGRNK